MEHVVFFPASDGTPAFHRLPSLEEAVRLVEHLRNVEGVSFVSVHALTEVPLAFRPYYRVEVLTGVDIPAQPAEPALEAPIAVEPPVAEPASAPALVEDLPSPPPADPAPEPEPEPEPELEPALATGNGHSKNAPASLGFFA